jgi:hypothetical protein
VLDGRTDAPVVKAVSIWKQRILAGDVLINMHNVSADVFLESVSKIGLPR